MSQHTMETNKVSIIHRNKDFVNHWALLAKFHGYEAQKIDVDGCKEPIPVESSIKYYSPNIAFVDVNWAPGNDLDAKGLKVLEELVKAEIPTCMLSEGPEYRNDALSNGAIDYILLSGDTNQFETLLGRYKK